MRTTPLCCLQRSISSQAPKKAAVRRSPASTSTSSSSLPSSNTYLPASSPPPRTRSTRQKSSLPQTELFRTLQDVSGVRNRPTLINEDSARDLIRAWGVDKMHDVVVVESYAGPGGITRALLELKNVKRVIALEDTYRYTTLLQDLKSKQSDPERLQVMKGDGYNWDAYSAIEANGWLDDVPKLPWDQENNGLFVAVQQPNNRHAEQFVLQSISAAATKMWYWQYGRFSMGFLGPMPYWDKIFAPVGDLEHRKVGVLLASVASITPSQMMSTLIPPELHFHKPRATSGVYTPVKVTPRIEPLANDFDALSYVTKHMFVSKSTPWDMTMSGLAPGAANLVPKILERGGPELGTPVISLKMQDWAVISNVFAEWPFRPNELFDLREFSEAAR